MITAVRECRCCENLFNTSGPVCWECVVGRIGCKNCMDIGDIYVKTARSKVHVMRNADRTVCGIRVNDWWLSVFPTQDQKFCSKCVSG